VLTHLFCRAKRLTLFSNKALSVGTVYFPKTQLRKLAIRYHQLRSTNFGSKIYFGSTILGFLRSGDRSSRWTKFQFLNYFRYDLSGFLCTGDHASGWTTFGSLNIFGSTHFQAFARTTRSYFYFSVDKKLSIVLASVFLPHQLTALGLADAA